MVVEVCCYIVLVTAKRQLSWVEDEKMVFYGRNIYDEHLKYVLMYALSREKDEHPRAGSLDHDFPPGWWDMFDGREMAAWQRML